MPDDPNLARNLERVRKATGRRKASKVARRPLKPTRPPAGRRGKEGPAAPRYGIPPGETPTVMQRAPAPKPPAGRRGIPPGETPIVGPSGTAPTDMQRVRGLMGRGKVSNAANRAVAPAVAPRKKPMPPGIQKQVARGRQLPPGIAKRTTAAANPKRRKVGR